MSSEKSTRAYLSANTRVRLGSFTIVGLADRACQEAKHRVRSGIASAELEWPRTRLTVNLAPAGLRKEGSGFDLPIALAVLAASEQLPRDALAGHAAIGELALDGRLRPVPGAHAPPEATSVDDATAAPDLSDLRGQERARRALEIAAAGGHNLLLAGPPGTGKTMLARRLPGILPLLEDDGALEVTRRGRV